MKIFLLTFFTFFSTVLATDVTVSILPQKYFVEKIAKDKVNVNVMVKPGFSPATYEPKTSQMKMLSKSKIYFSIDVPFEEAWLEKFKNANKNMLVIDTSKGIAKIEMEAHEHHDEHEEHAEKKHEEKDHHDHGHGHKHDEHKKHDDHKDEKKDDHHDHDEHKDEHKDEHAGHKHEGLDPHVWLDPILVKTQAKNIFDALVKVDAKNKDFYKTNYESFLKELDSLDLKLKDILKNSDDKAFLVFHPSWGYFSKRYHLEQISIEIQGKEPKPAQLIELIKETKKHNIKIVFVAPQFSQSGAKAISKSIDGNVVVIDPLSHEWEKSLIQTANEIAKSYK